ncbi:MAG: Fic family protein [Bacilli bacterium]|nr:Fic family protein [Bacilli bacterium]
MSEQAIRERQIIQYVLEKAGVNIPFIIKEAFLGYKYRKKNKILYEDDASVATELIRMYYALNPGEIEFDNLRKSFIKKYVKNESEIEGVNDLDIHGKQEIAGLQDMYEYLFSDNLKENFNIYTLCDLNKKLFSYAPFPEYAGEYRTHDAYLPGTGVPLSEWRYIFREIRELSPIIDHLLDRAQLVKELCDSDELLKFLDACVELEVALIKIHPFPDGNGRTVRAFINKLLSDAGLPAIYIKSNERTEYHNAMNDALINEDYTHIKSFYRYKVCDSIIELDINDRLKKEKDEKPKQKKKTDDLK